VSNISQVKEWQDEVTKQIQQGLGLPANIGMGPGKFMARVATDSNAIVAQDEIAEFLRDIPLSRIHWIDYNLLETLRNLGLTTLGKVRDVKRNVVVQQVGAAGGRLHDWITGKDSRPVQALYPPDKQSATQKFDCEDNEHVIVGMLERLCQQLGDKLEAAGREAGQLTVRVQDITGFQTVSQQRSRPLRKATAIYQVAERLLKQLWQRQPLHSLELVAGDLQPVEAHQMDLWRSYQRVAIEQAMAAARRHYGLGAISKASELEDSRRFAQMILGAKGRFSW